MQNSQDSGEGLRRRSPKIQQNQQHLKGVNLDKDMTDDIFDKIQDCIDNLEAIHGADLGNMWFKIAEEDDDLKKRFHPKTYRWTKNNPSD